MRGRGSKLAVVVGGMAAAGVLGITGDDVAALGRTKRVVERANVSATGIQASSSVSGRPAALSGDGRFVCFDADTTNLVAGDTNGRIDIFVRDRLLGTTERVSVADDEAQSNGHSFSPDISADGRFVVFESEATNLVTGDTNGVTDLFVRDRVASTTVRVSVGTGGVQSNGTSFEPDISPDGGFVAFSSAATNLLGAGGDTNSNDDIFVRDLQAGTTARVSVTTAGDPSTGGPSRDPAISAGGRLVTFTSLATNLVSGDTNNLRDIFVRDRVGGTTERVSLATSGQQALGGESLTPRLSADGRVVVFESSANNLVSGDTNNAADVFLRDRVAGTTECLSISPGGAVGSARSTGPDVSADGMFVAFISLASNLVPSVPSNGTNIYRRNRAAGETERVDLLATGETPDTNALTNGGISGDGRSVAFTSGATNLVPRDTNGAFDLFVVATAVVPGTRIAIFRPGTREWFARDDDGSTSSVTFGGPGDQPVPADYLGLGNAQVAIFRPSTAQWFIRSEAGSTVGPIVFGATDGIPVPGDYLGTGRAQLSTFSAGAWVVREEPEAVLVVIGGPGDIPVPADYLGLGRLQRAVFRPSTRQWLIHDPRTNGQIVIEYGGSGDRPVPGDYFGIGRASIAIFRPSTGEWYLRHDNGSTTRIPFGAAGDTPVPGDYLEAGHDQLAVFRPSTRTWILRDDNFVTFRVDFGGPNDQPIPVRFRPRF